MESIQEQLKQIIARGLRLGDDAVASLSDDAPLLGGELEIDSIDILQIILEIERHFGIKLVTGKFEREEWASINHLAATVQARLAEAGEGDDARRQGPPRAPRSAGGSQQYEQVGGLHHTIRGAYSTAGADVRGGRRAPGPPGNRIPHRGVFAPRSQRGTAGRGCGPNPTGRG